MGGRLAWMSSKDNIKARENVQATWTDIKQHNLWEASGFTEKDGNADTAKASWTFWSGKESCI